MSVALNTSIIAGTTRLQDLLPKFCEVAVQLEDPEVNTLFAEIFGGPVLGPTDPFYAAAVNGQPWPKDEEANWRMAFAREALPTLTSWISARSPSGYLFSAKTGADWGFWEVTNES